MSAVHISEAEFVRDVRAALDRVCSGAEIIVDLDNKAAVVIRPALPAAPTLGQIVAAMEAGGVSGRTDEDFARDVAEGVARFDQPWNPPSWD